MIFATRSSPKGIQQNDCKACKQRTNRQKKASTTFFEIVLLSIDARLHHYRCQINSKNFHKNGTDRIVEIAIKTQNDGEIKFMKDRYVDWEQFYWVTLNHYTTVFQNSVWTSEMYSF